MSEYKYFNQLVNALLEKKKVKGAGTEIAKISGKSKNSIRTLLKNIDAADQEKTEDILLRTLTANQGIKLAKYFGHIKLVDEIAINLSKSLAILNKDTRPVGVKFNEMVDLSGLSRGTLNKAISYAKGEKTGDAADVLTVYSIYELPIGVERIVKLYKAKPKKRKVNSIKRKATQEIEQSGEKSKQNQLINTYRNKIIEKNNNMKFGISDDNEKYIMNLPFNPMPTPRPKAMAVENKRWVFYGNKYEEWVTQVKEYVNLMLLEETNEYKKDPTAIGLVRFLMGKDKEGHYYKSARQNVLTREGKPVKQKRSRQEKDPESGEKRRVYFEENKTEIRNDMKGIKLSFEFVIAPPKTGSPLKLYPTDKDTDNYIKGVMDTVFQNIYFKQLRIDDGMVGQFGGVLKRYAVEGEQPHVIIKFEHMDMFLS